MLDALLYLFLAAFGLVAGFFIGTGNRNGLLGSLIPGVAAGLLVSIPFLRESDWTSTGLLVIVAVIGSVIASLTADENRVKRFCREQTNLRIRCGSYRIGSDARRK